MHGGTQRLLDAARHSRLFAMVALSAPAHPSSFLSRAKFEAAKAAAVREQWAARLPVEDFLQRGGLLGGGDESAPPILDVRAPCEYDQGHIPGAINVPLFTDEERAEVRELDLKAAPQSDRFRLRAAKGRSNPVPTGWHSVQAQRA